MPHSRCAATSFASSVQSVFRVRFGRVPDEDVDLRWPEIAWIDLNQSFPGFRVDAFFVDAFAMPFDAPIDNTKGPFDKFSGRCAFRL